MDIHFFRLNFTYMGIQLEHSSETLPPSLYIVEAERYLENALESLKKAGNASERLYKDAKYVQAASGVAYLAALLAADAFLASKGRADNDMPELIEEYRKALKGERVGLNLLNSVYEILHLHGYYRKVTQKSWIQEGIQAVRDLIEWARTRTAPAAEVSAA
jgi:hypothetical protein